MPAVYWTKVPLELDCSPYLPLFSPKRQGELARKTPAHRALSVCGGLLLLYGLRARGWNGSLADLKRAPGGKPYLPGGAPEVNLSHSGDMVVCAISSRGVGVDIEAVATSRDREIVRLFHPAEQDWFAALPPREKTGAFYALWTHKESYMKYTGLGAALPLDRFSVRRPGTAAMAPGAGCDPDCRFQSRELPGYRLALCCQSQNPVSYIPIEFGKLRWEGIAP